MRKPFIIVIVCILVVFGSLGYAFYKAPIIETDLLQSLSRQLSLQNLMNRPDTLVNVTVQGRQATLEGYTSTTSMRERISGFSQNVFGIQSVNNNMGITSKPSIVVTPLQETTRSVLRDTVVLDKITCDEEVCTQNIENIENATKKDDM